jgi:hypothetical protein
MHSRVRVEARRDRAGTLTAYRPAEGELIPSCRVGCVDVLAGGKQIHPNTQQRYQWVDSHFNLATANIDEAPSLTAAALASFLDAICSARSSARISATTSQMAGNAVGQYLASSGAAPQPKR